MSFKYAPSHMEYPSERRKRIACEVCAVVGSVVLFAAMWVTMLACCVAFD